MGGVVCCILKLVDSASLEALLGEDLRGDCDKAGTLERDDLREAEAHLVSDVTWPGGVRLSVLLRRRPEGWPAGNVHIDVLLVLVVSEESLGMLPAVETSDSDIRELGAGHHALERLALAIAPVGPLDVGGLDLAAMVDNDSVLVDE